MPLDECPTPARWLGDQLIFTTAPEMLVEPAPAMFTVGPEALTPEVMAIYGQRSTGAKVLIDPSRDLRA